MAYKGTKKIRDAVLREYGNICHLCNELIIVDDIENGFTVDHLIPRSKGGTDNLENLRSAHARCNYRRRDLPMSEWRSQTTDEMIWFTSLQP